MAWRRDHTNFKVLANVYYHIENNNRKWKDYVFLVFEIYYYILKMYIYICSFKLLYALQLKSGIKHIF
jgi:hypothetical protein